MGPPENNLNYMTIPISRRAFLATPAVASVLIASDAVRNFEAWQRGWLDIHHISTGRGNSVLAICPDGTSIMIDAGAVKGSTEAMGPARPDSTRRPGEWIGRYALHHLRSAPKQEIDYFVLTHFHGDHMGDITSDSPSAPDGTYKLSGVSDVAEQLPIHRLIDRGYPDYGYPAAPNYDGTVNYIRFVRAIEKRGTRVEKLKPGSDRQIAAAGVTIRNLAANGEVWTGTGDDTRQMFPTTTNPPENACSIALRFNYGSFAYYTGGDLTCDTAFGTAPWLDVETAVAKAAGPVSVSAVNHHGYFDATGPDFVRYMRSRIYILQTWHASHPALSVLDRLYSPILYPGDRDVLATGLVPAAGLADARFSDRMLSQQGHIVVRVSEAGKRFEILVLDDTREQGQVKARFGPWAVRAG
jgi:beta-lactamase superfamily II metal-dependent hydrolase